jgi:UDP-N-acetylglucosamine:LPS N-acetylglucosamine transferase
MVVETAGSDFTESHSGSLQNKKGNVCRAKHFWSVCLTTANQRTLVTLVHMVTIFGTGTLVTLMVTIFSRGTLVIMVTIFGKGTPSSTWQTYLAQGHW